MSSAGNKAMEMESPPPMPTSPPPKKQRLLPPSSSADFGKTKVCIVCRSHSPDEQSTYIYIYDIFVVDLFSDKDGVPGSGTCEEFKPRSPTFRLEDGCFLADAFCVLGSTLYMFEGYPQNPEGKSVASLSLDLATESSVKLKRSMLINEEAPLPDLLHPKRHPAAIPTPDGKILVFSKLINCNPYAVDIDFELYDPTGSSSRKLPGICGSNVKIWIWAYTLLQEWSVFIIQTQIGIFSLDLRRPDDEGWVMLNSYCGVSPIPYKNGLFSIIGGELLLTSFAVFDMKRKLARRCRFPSPFDDMCVYQAAVPLGDGFGDSGDFNFCLVYTGQEEEDDSMHPRLAIQLCRSNLKTIRDETEKLVPRDVVISFKFHLNAHQYYSIRPNGVFAF